MVITMDAPDKRSSLGEYRGMVGSALTDLQMQLERNRQEILRFSENNRVLQNNVHTLESANRFLNEELLAKQSEIRRLKVQVEELRLLHEESTAARREYDRYLDTVGQVYMVACESADSIVSRAEKNARKILDERMKESEAVRYDAEKPLRTMQALRDSLSESLGTMMATVQRSFSEMDTWMLSAETASPAFPSPSSLETHRQGIAEIEEDLNSYYQRSRAIIAESEQAREDHSPQESYPSSPYSASLDNTDESPDSPSLGEADSSAIEAERLRRQQEMEIFSPLQNESTEEPEKETADGREESLLDTTKPRSRMTLVEQEKLRRKEASASPPSPPADALGEPRIPPSPPTDTGDAPITGRRQKTVKDLLGKYSQWK